VTSKRSTRAAKRHEQPAAIEIKRPKDEPTLTITPASGPNIEGEGHVIRSAHTLDEDALAKRRNHIAPPAENDAAAKET
jgi:hypothetical protein